MKVYSKSKPKKVDTQKIENDLRVRLTKNVESVEIETESGETDFIFEYDEVVFTVKDRQNIKQSIENNFDKWFDFGVELQDKNENMKRKSAEVRKLVDEYQLPDELDSLFNALAESYEDLLEESLINQMAIAELFELIEGGE